jgi:hypothetical protein
MYTVKRVKAIHAVLARRYTHNGTLLRWPQWLHWKHILVLEGHELIKQTNGGPATYNHTTIHVKEIK